MNEGLYLLWGDVSKKPAEKILHEGIQAYIERFGVTPRVVVVNINNPVTSNDIDVQPHPDIQPCDYWLGMKRRK